VPAPQRALRDQLEATLGAAGLVVRGPHATSAQHHQRLRPRRVRGSPLSRVPELAFSTGSACHAGEEHASRALLAIGIPAGEALGAVRLTLGRWTTAAEVDRAAELLVAAARGLGAQGGSGGLSASSPR